MFADPTAFMAADPAKALRGQVAARRGSAQQRCIAVAVGRATYPAGAIAAVDCVVLTWPNSAWSESRIRTFWTRPWQASDMN